jgi:hypothetical protein
LTAAGAGFVLSFRLRAEPVFVQPSYWLDDYWWTFAVSGARCVRRLPSGLAAVLLTLTPAHGIPWLFCAVLCRSVDRGVGGCGGAAAARLRQALQQAHPQQGECHFCISASVPF